MSDLEVTIELNDRVSQKLKNIDRAASGLSKTLKVAATAAAAIATGAIANSIVRQYTAYEKYRTVLTTFLGSQQKANKELERLQKLANSLPQDLEDVTQAFTIFTRTGIDTSSKSLTALSNIATANGKTLSQLAEAVADSITGEFERLKEFGIKVSKENDRFVARIGDQQVAIADSTAELTNRLVQLGNTRFGGAAAANAGTLSQSLSNLKGAANEAAIAFMEGLAPALKEISDSTAQLLRNNKELIRSLGQGVGEALRTIGSLARTVADSWDTINAIMLTFIGLKVGDYLSRLLGRMIRFTNGARTASGVVSGLTKALTASGTAAVVAAGQWTGATTALAILATKAGKAASALGLLTFSSDLNADELADPIFTTTNAIYGATEAMKNFAGTSDELDELISKNNAVVESVKALMDAQDQTDPNGAFVYNNLAEALLAYNGALYTAKNGVKALNEEQQDMITGANDYNKRLQELMSNVEEEIALKGWAREALSQLTQEYDDGILSLEKYMEAKERLHAILGINDDKVKSSTEKLNEQLGVVDQTVKAVKDQKDEMLALQRAYQNITSLAKKYGLTEQEVKTALDERLASMVEVIDKSDEMSSTVKDFTENLKGRFEGLAGSMTSTFRDMFTGVKSGFEGLRDIAKMVLGQILDALIQIIIVQPLINAMTGGLGSIFGGFFADGGRVNNSSKPIIVGEKGPEVFMPNGAGTVIPNHELGGGGDGGNLNVTFEINAVDTQTGVQFLIDNKNIIEGVIQSAYNKRGKAGPLG